MLPFGEGIGNSNARLAASRKVHLAWIGVNDPGSRADAILTSLDASVQVAHTGNCARAETFDVTVTPSTVNLLPETGTVSVTEELERCCRGSVATAWNSD